MGIFKKFKITRRHIIITFIIIGMLLLPISLQLGETFSSPNPWVLALSGVVFISAMMFAIREDRTEAVRVYNDGITTSMIEVSISAARYRNAAKMERLIPKSEHLDIVKMSLHKLIEDSIPGWTSIRMVDFIECVRENMDNGSRDNESVGVAIRHFCLYHRDFLKRILIADPRFWESMEHSLNIPMIQLSTPIWFRVDLSPNMKFI